MSASSNLPVNRFSISAYSHASLGTVMNWIFSTEIVSNRWCCIKRDNMKNHANKLADPSIFENGAVAHISSSQLI